MTSRIDYCITSLNTNLHQVSSFFSDNSFPISDSTRVIDASFDALSHSIDCLRSLFGLIKSPPNQSLQFLTPPPSTIFAPLFADYLRLGIDFLSRNVFPWQSITPLAIEFAHFQHLHLKFVSLSSSPPNIPQFRRIWDCHFRTITHISAIYKSLNIPTFIPKLEEIRTMFTSGCELPLTTVGDSVAALNEVIHQMNRLTYSAASFQAAILAVSTLRDYLSGWCERPLPSFFFPQFAQRVSVVRKLLCFLEACMAGLQLGEFAARIDPLVQSASFEIDPRAFRSAGSQMRATAQTFALMGVAAGLLAALPGGRGQPEGARRPLVKAGRALAALARGSDDALRPACVAPHLSVFQELQIAADEELEARAVAWTERVAAANGLAAQHAAFAAAMGDDELGFADRFLARFLAFAALESGFAALESAETERLARFRWYLASCFLCADLQAVGALLLALLPDWDNAYRKRELEAYQYQLATTAATLATGLNRLIAMEARAKDAVIFVEFFAVFLDVFQALVALNAHTDCLPLIHFALTSFPGLDMMKRALPIGPGLSEAFETAAEIQERTIAIAARLREQLSTAVLVPLLAEIDGVAALIGKLTHVMEGLRCIVKFLGYYEMFFASFAKVPEQLIAYRQDTAISAPIVEHFPRMSQVLLGFLRSNFMNPNRSSRLFEPWIRFIRSVILNEDGDRRQIFTRLVELIPFIDLATPLQRSLLALKRIEACIDLYKFRNPDTNPALSATFIALHSHFVQSLCSGRGFGPDYDAKCRQFLGSVTKTSAQLFEEVNRHWPKVVHFAIHIANLQTLQLMVRHLRNDLSVEAQDPFLFSFHFTHFVSTTLRSMAIASRAYCAPQEVTAHFTHFRAAFEEIMKDYGLLFTPHSDANLHRLAIEVEGAKEVWVISLVDDIDIELRHYCLTLMSSYSLLDSSPATPVCQQLEEIGELLCNQELPLDQFTRLSNAYSIFELMRSPLLHKESHKKLKDLFEYALTVFMVADQISIAEIFITRLITDRQTIPKIEHQSKSKILTQLDELPALFAELARLSSGNNACVEYLRRVRWQLDVLLRKGVSPDLSREFAEVRLLIEKNRSLMQQLHDCKEDALRQKLALIRNEQGLVTELKERQSKKEKLEARLEAKSTELRGLENVCGFLRGQFARPRIPVEPFIAIPLPRKADRQRTRKSSEIIDSSMLNKELKQVLGVNQQLREQLRVRKPVRERKAQLMGCANPDNEEDGMNVQFQEEMIENVFKTLHQYRRIDWNNPTNYRKTALELVRQIEKLVCLKYLKIEHRQKLGKRINAIKQSVEMSKSALVQLLNDD